MELIPIGPPISPVQGVGTGYDWALVTCRLGEGVNYPRQLSPGSGSRYKAPEQQFPSILGLLQTGRMGHRSNLSFALLCWVVSGVTCYNPWDFSRSDSAIWRPTPRAEPPRRQAHVPSLSQPSPWARVDASQLRAVSPLQPVMVQCEEAQMVITVHRDLFGVGRLIKAADLSLGPAACRYTSLNDAENTVIFAAGLHECGSTLQVRIYASQEPLLIPSITAPVLSDGVKMGQWERTVGGILSLLLTSSLFFLGASS